MCHAGHAPNADGGSAPPDRSANPIAALIPPLLARGLRERDDLVALAERIRNRTVRAVREGQRPGKLTLRREVDAAGRRVWAVREDRDVWLPYVERPRAFMAMRPGRRARDMLGLMSAVVAAALAAARETEPVAPSPMRVVR